MNSKSAEYENPSAYATSAQAHAAAANNARRCKNSLLEFGSYAWDSKAVDDRPIKDHDHAMDDIRYFCNTIMRRLLIREGREDDEI